MSSVCELGDGQVRVSLAAHRSSMTTGYFFPITAAPGRLKVRRTPAREIARIESYAYRARKA
jgi:hypothetical protein